MITSVVIATVLGLGAAGASAQPQATPNCAYTSAMREAARLAAANAAMTPVTSVAESSSILACPVGCSVAWGTRAAVPPRALGGFGLEGAEAAVIGSKIYVGHGNAQAVDEPSLRIYDIPTDTWSFGADSFLARSEGVGAEVGGKLYAFGGRNTPACEEYDPATNLWVLKSGMPTRRKGMAVGVIADQVHVIGGTAGNGPHQGTSLAVHEVYTPATDTWSVAASLPTPLADIYASAVIGTKMYIFGGFTGTGVVPTTHIYDSITDSWSTGADMPTARSNAVAGVLCGQIFVIGGLPTGLGANLTTVEVYDPATNLWCTGPAKPTGVAEGSTSGISTPTTIHVIGSGHSGNSLSTHEVLELQPSCLVSGLGPIRQLVGVQAGVDAQFSWQMDAGSTSYHLNTVRVKTDIPAPQSQLPPVGVSTAQCDVATTTCLDRDAIADGTLLYYQVYAACGPAAADEGPFF